MFAKRIELFSILGFRVSLDRSWVILAVLITWSLATGYFPQIIDGVNPVAAWWLGAAGALGLFASIILHEFSHSWIARQFDMPIRGITLFIFGGVAEMDDEPPSPRAEFFMAIAGPLMSFALAVLFYALSGLLPGEMIAALLMYLAAINTMLATFNLIPAFPLDGGRVFRAALWWRTNDYAKATRIAASLGRFFGAVLIMFGVLALITGNPMVGIWQGLIGLFIIAAANSSELQMALKSGFKDKTVGQIMVRDLVVIPADTPLENVVEDYFFRRHHRVFPVVRGSELLGCIRIEDVGRIARAERAQRTAGDVLSKGGKIATVAPETPVMDALKRMRDLETSRLMIAKNGELKGMLTMRDILADLTIREELNARGHRRRNA